MESQKRQLEAALLSDGWQIAEREAITSEWWADEIWTIKSEWRPVGFTLFLTFVVEPQSGQRRRGEEVMAVSCSSVRVHNFGDAMGGNVIFLRPSWERNLINFMSGVRDIRDRATVS